MELRHDSHGTPMVLPWGFHEISKGLTWESRGACVKDKWYIYVAGVRAFVHIQAVLPEA